MAAGGVRPKPLNPGYTSLMVRLRKTEIWDISIDMSKGILISSKPNYIYGGELKVKDELISQTNLHSLELRRLHNYRSHLLLQDIVWTR